MNEDRLLSERVLLSAINNWKELSDYYHPNSKNDKIPFNEVKAIIRSTPTAGEDATYIDDDRFRQEYKRGRVELARKIQQVLKEEKND